MKRLSRRKGLLAALLLVLTGGGIGFGGACAEPRATEDLPDAPADPEYGGDHGGGNQENGGDDDGGYAGGGSELPADDPALAIEKKVGAVYFVWYKKGEEHQPGEQRSILGKYDSADEAVIRQHLEWLKMAKVDFIAVSWWGPKAARQNAIIKRLLEIVPEYDIKLCIMMEAAWEGLKTEFDYILSDFATSPSYLQFEGKPVVFTFWRVTKNAKETGGEEYFKEYLRRLYIVRDNFGGGVVRDGFGVWKFTPVYDKPQDWQQKLERLAGYRAQKRFLFVAPVIPGYDSRHIKPQLGAGAEKSDQLYYPREGTRFYERSWRSSLKAKPDWVMVITFNGFPEWHGVEPSEGVGKDAMEYIRETAKWVERFKNGG
ncbi:MAG TPA: hypothetical protein VGC54_09190 [Planctomycetota bacterium]